MPEGDVLLHVTRRLDTALAGREVVRSELRWGDLGAVDLTGARVVECVSHGKNSLIRFDSGHTLHTHLKMDGTWRIDPTRTPPHPYRDPRVRVVLANEEWTCVSRLTGRVQVFLRREEQLWIGALGPDLLAGQPGAADPDPPDFPAIAVAASAAGSSRGIGELLLDQRVAAGIGTIYLAESLWIARIHPLTPVADLPVETIERIYRTAAALMTRSADVPSADVPSAGGSCFTATGDLRPGWRTHVHGRDHLPCRRCGHQIAKVSVGRPPYARPGFYCPACQPAPTTGGIA